jgi:hypothetical protein
MAIEYTWTINSLETVETEAYSKVVKVVRWSYTGVDADSGFSHNISRFTNLDTDNIETFVEFADLTEDAVITWLDANVAEDEVNEMQNLIDLSVQRRLASRTMTTHTTLPWATPETQEETPE